MSASATSLSASATSLDSTGKLTDESSDKTEEETGSSHHPLDEVPFVDKDNFAVVMACVVIANVIFIGLETEFGHTSDFFGAINNGFLLCYIVELMMRMLTHGMKALRDVFTCMDLILVFLAFLERILTSGGVARALPTFRMLRVSRLLRKSRYLRHSRELRAIATASVDMLKTLFWVVIVLFFLLWTLATFAHIVIGRSAEWNETMDPSKTLPAFTALDIQEYFGSVSKSFLTLLQVATVSQWAPHIARPIVKVYPVTFAFFVIFFFVTTYGLIVSIVSNLVQDSMLASKENAKAIKEREREDRKKIGLTAIKILEEVDSDGSGALDADEIRLALESTNLREILRELGVPVLDAESLVSLLDYSGDGTVNFSELVEGACKMDEEITPRDYAMMGFWVKSLLLRAEFLEVRLEKICNQISFIRRRLGGSFGALDHMIRTSQDSQMRAKSLLMLRTTGPPLPPSIEKKVVVRVTLPAREPKLELQSFASRLLGMPPKPKLAGSADLDDSAPRTVALFHNTMSSAPPRLEVDQRRWKKKEQKSTDRYALDESRFGLANPEARQLTVLKSLL